MGVFASQCGPRVRAQHAPVRASLLSVLLTCSVGLAGCGGGSEGPETAENTVGDATREPVAAEPGGACNLVPVAEVEAVLGQAVRPNLVLDMPATDETGSLSQCNYDTESIPAVASLMLRQNRPGETTASAVSSVRESMVEAGGEIEAVPGLGDTAFWAAPQLHVFVEGWYVIVSPTEGGGVEEARALAERALERL